MPAQVGECDCHGGSCRAGQGCFLNIKMQHKYKMVVANFFIFFNILKELNRR